MGRIRLLDEDLGQVWKHHQHSVHLTAADIIDMRRHRLASLQSPSQRESETKGNPSAAPGQPVMRTADALKTFQQRSMPIELIKCLGERRLRAKRQTVSVV
jgi:hypothetical protein